MKNIFLFEAEPFEAYSEPKLLQLKARRPFAPGGGFFRQEPFQGEMPHTGASQARRARPVPPGGGRFQRETELFEFEVPGPTPGVVVGTCIPVPPILTSASAISQAIAFNRQSAQSLGWGTLVDQIEVNLFGCPRTGGRLAPADFAQAVALFQRNQGLTVDGKLGPVTWTRMKTIQAERDPFPRASLAQDFDATPDASLCELHRHPALDIAVPAGTPIPVVADGLVLYAGDVGTLESCAVATGCVHGTSAAVACNTLSYGRAVIVEHTNRGPGPQPRGLSVYTIYAHVQFSQRHRVATGQRVNAGQLIAEVGANCVGFSTGPHLHYVVASGRRLFRLQRGPSRPQICGNFWPVVTPQRPRTTIAAGFRW
jgi:hypothetical protein